MSTTGNSNPPPTWTVGCVSFLNARPLIDGLDGQTGLRIRYDVPSRLLEDLLRGQADVALCPVVDYQLSPQPLWIVPAGGIGCDGPTLTVRLYSRVPFEAIAGVAADTDSHTSVVLARLILHDRYRLRPTFSESQLREVDWKSPSAPATVLLIGDKVVTSAPADADYPFQLDLGQAWKEMTGLPFVFAVWMCRAGADLGDLPRRLERCRNDNATRIDSIVAASAGRTGFPADLARLYLGRLLKYPILEPQLNAMRTFWQRAHELSLLPQNRPLHLYQGLAAIR